jgi:hypothetical protein
MTALPEPDLPAGETVLRIRRSSSSTQAFALREVLLAAFDDAVPWRTPAYRRGQTNRPGEYWAVTERAHVAYESLAELAALLNLDRDPDIRRILAQPCQLLVNNPNGRTYVPDFLSVRNDKSVEIMEVKPLYKTSDPKIRATLGWAMEVLENHGWSYLVVSEPGQQATYNLRFLAGYRRTWQFNPTLLATVRLETYEPEFFGILEARMADLTGSSRSVMRAHLLHLIWAGELTCDLKEPLDRGTVLIPAGRTEWSQE